MKTALQNILNIQQKLIIKQQKLKNIANKLPTEQQILDLKKRLDKLELSGEDTSSQSSLSINFLKCASVDTDNKTWSGYKIEWINDNYLISDVLVQNLSYKNGGFIPAVGKIYDSKCTLIISSLKTEINKESLIFCIQNGDVVIGSVQTAFNTNVNDGKSVVDLSDRRYMLTNISLDVLANDFTIITNIKLLSGNRTALFAAYDSDYKIGIDNNKGKWCIWAGNGNYWNIFQSDSTASTDSGVGIHESKRDQWYKIALVKQGSTWKLYINDQLSISKVSDESIAAGSLLCFNKWGNGMYCQPAFYGDTYIFTQSLSEVQLATINF